MGYSSSRVREFALVKLGEPVDTGCTSHVRSLRKCGLGDVLTGEAKMLSCGKPYGGFYEF